MAYVVSAACVWSCARSCVQVCPVDCFYADELQNHISPDECIDCGACEPECPSSAIRYEEQADHPEVLAARERITRARPAARLPLRTQLEPEQHRARRDAFLVDLARAAQMSGRPEMVRALEAWLPHEPLKSGEPRPPAPANEVLEEMIGLLRACFPDRWAGRIDDVRGLIAVRPWERLLSDDGEDGD